MRPPTTGTDSGAALLPIPNRYPHRPVQTRYLIVAALLTALVILGASLVWFLRIAS